MSIQCGCRGVPKAKLEPKREKENWTHKSGRTMQKGINSKVLEMSWKNENLTKSCKAVTSKGKASQAKLYNAFDQNAGEWGETNDLD